LIRTSTPALRAHHERVSAMSWALADLAGIEESRALLVGVAGWLHDIGMVLVPPETEGDRDAEPDGRDIIRRHCTWGHEILTMTGDPELGIAAVVAQQHHERWDGSGYPHRLRGDEIAIEARIVALCSTYDSLRRPSRNARRIGHSEAVALLRRRNPRSGLPAFDPDLCDLIAANRARFAPIIANFEAAQNPAPSILPDRVLAGREGAPPLASH
jgi:HD-GYP domain-containing protein (c-di-GMP phosphodiesterase class II)